MRTSTVWVEIYVSPVYWCLKERFLSTETIHEFPDVFSRPKSAEDGCMMSVFCSFLKRKSQEIHKLLLKSSLFLFFCCWIYIFSCCFISSCNGRQYHNYILQSKNINIKEFLWSQKSQCILEFCLNISFCLEFIFFKKVMLTFCVKREFNSKLDL